MASGYKVRIADGSEIGPLDLAAVKSWYSQGLLTKDSAVLKPGTNKWTTLAHVLDLGPGKAAAPRASGGDTGRASAGASRDVTIDVPDPSRWRTPLAGTLLLLLAAVLGYFAYKPQDTRIELQDAPWLQIALSVVVLGLALLPGWEATRKIVRIGVFVLAILLFPVAGILLAQGVRNVTLLAVLGAAVCLFGFFTLLAGEWISWPRAVLSLVPILGGAYAFAHYTHSPETAARRELREWTSPDRHVAVDTLGVSVSVPRGWVLLKSGNPLLAAPPEARALFGHPRGPGFGYLLAESSPPGVSSVEQYLDRAWAARQRQTAGLKQVGRSDLHVGRQPAKRLSGAWDDPAEGRYQETITAWRDGWVYFALVTWLHESPRGEREVDSLLQGVNTQGEFATRLQTAVVNATVEVPQLTPDAAELLMSGSEAKVLEPDQAFRRSIEALSNALPGLSKQDSQELGQITTATYAALPARERARLLSYVARVRDRQPTSSAEDREASRLMKAAVMRLPPARRERLQGFYTQAIRAATASK